MRKVEPGEWYAVIGDDIVVLLPPEAKPRVARVWEAVDDGLSFDEVLDALISGGLRGISGFMVVAGRGPDLKVVIRGAGEAELSTSEGPVRMSGSADTTWVEHNLSGVTGFRVRVAEGTDPAYAAGPGLLRVASVEQPATGAAAPSDLPDADVVAVPVEPVEPVEPTEPDEATGPIPPPPPRDRPILPPDPQLESEIPSPPVEPPAPPARVLPPDPQLQPPPEPPEPPEPPASPEPHAYVPDVGGGSDYDPLTSPDLAVTPSHRSEVGDATPVARLLFSSGEVIDVDRPIVIGRAPDHGPAGRDEYTRLVTVASPHQEISSTHLEIRPGTGPDHGSAVATDLGSTNGTLVVQPGLPAEDLRPGIAVALAPGATIDLGDGITIEVEGGRSDRV